MEKGNEENKVCYQCFSLPLKERIEAEGIKSEFKAKHIKTDRVFWLYLFDGQGKLKKVLDEWSVKKPMD